MGDTVAARGYVVYEYSMLLFAVQAEAKLLEALPADAKCFGSRAHLGSVVRDSALLHARALFYFLTCDRKYLTDVIASDFLEDADNPGWRASVPRLESFIQDINKFRGHISYERSTREWIKWDLPEILVEVQDAFDEFLSELLPVERQAWDVALADRLKWQTEPADQHSRALR
ncbi:MAG: hypothetical protein JRE40_09215 [Deltaproteobacteria bacterium]|nr:hypothetical protein [Deltaproteobacteria bacterium]